MFILTYEILCYNLYEGGDIKLNERQLNVLEDLYYSPLLIDSNQMMLKYNWIY